MGGLEQSATDFRMQAFPTIGLVLYSVMAIAFITYSFLAVTRSRWVDAAPNIRKVGFRLIVFVVLPTQAFNYYLNASVRSNPHNCHESTPPNGQQYKGVMCDFSFRLYRSGTAQLLAERTLREALAESREPTWEDDRVLLGSGIEISIPPTWWDRATARLP